LLTIVNLKENLSNLKTFFDPNPIKIQSPNAIFYPATKPIINQALIKLKFTFSEKATKIDKIFTVNLPACSNQGVALAREKLAGSIDGVGQF